MLTLSQCKEYLDEETQKELSDEQIIQIRDALQGVADVILEAMSKDRNNLKSPSVDYSKTNVL